MLRTPSLNPANTTGTTLPDRAALSAQLTKILGSTHFRNSKRSQALLRFVVEAASSGGQNSLKERQIGAAVFGRETAYDTAQDPIVRNAAIEVRKRLAQYYLEAEHAYELRIELPLGSYLPTFTVEAPAVEQPKPAPAVRRYALKWGIAVAILMLVAAVAAVLWGVRRTPASELDAFWEPLFRDRRSIQICVGQPTRLYRFIGPRMEDLNRILGGPPSADRNPPKLSIGADELTWVAPEYMFMRDAFSAYAVASWLQSKGRTYQLVSVSQTNYSRLRHEPLVAIGAFNNTWSMRVTSELRFVFDHRTIGGATYNYIHDRRNPDFVDWKVLQPANGNMPVDFAIVTRVFDSATEKTVISAAGIETYGTFAASEFVTQPEYLGNALRAAPKDWRRKNVQFVLGTRIIDGTPGPPRILASHFW
ncbi:MAG TPA: hypothetical protein VGH38_38560 [Bryobacteraceae bacterium]|jgi:hypothetical protein